jgi:signal transduction histidine kinase
MNKFTENFTDISTEVKESITNAVRHGHAQKIYITLKRENAVLYLEIKDNGIGCENITYGFGTRHMKERIEMLGGIVEFEGKNGFVVKAKIPIRWGKTYD